VSESPTPQVSVIVPVRNGAGSLPALLDSLRRQSLAAASFEVVVVDNASSDRSADVAVRGGARVVREPVANRARARNRGVEAARARLYAFTDADCVAAPHWLERLVGCADRAPLVAGPVRTRVSERPNAIERFEALWRFGQESWVRQGWAATANLAVAAGAFEAVGGFDPSLRHIGEDVDLCLRARAAGFELGWCPDAEVGHDAESRLLPTLKRAYRHGYSVNQVYYRFGLGYRAWRDPAPALVGDRALRLLGTDPGRFEPRERRRMVRLARLGYAGRVVGSAWADLVRAR
jgi:GT2 family glycosyltransferase